MSTRKRRSVRSLVTLLVMSIVAVGALVVGHFTHSAAFVPSLALDLQGGTQLILTPTATDAGERQITEDDITQAIAIIRNRVDASGVAEAEITSMGQDNIVVSLPGTPSQETLNLIRSSSQMNFRPVLQIAQAVNHVEKSSGDDSASQSEDADKSQSERIAEIEKMLLEEQAAQEAQSGTGELQPIAEQTAPEATSEEKTSDEEPEYDIVSTALDEQSAMQLADMDGDGYLSEEPASTPENASDLAWVTEKALYDFHVLDCTTITSMKRTEGPADKPYVACDSDGVFKYLLGPVAVAGANLESANPGQVTNSSGQPTGQWGVDLQFDREGTTQFAEASKILYSFQEEDPQGQSLFAAPDRNHFAAVLDGAVITAPSMNAIIVDGRAQISGSFTPASATALAHQLNFGSLPLNFEVQSEQRISATLGSDHLQKGLLAGLIGLLLVLVYLIWQYRGLSVIAAGSLILAGAITYLTITILSWAIGYRLSLAGVAGLIMAVGVTADSFIVYFERVRDEVRDGRPLLAAVDEGWDRAKRTILVSDAVNIVAAAVLYMLAVGGVQGFAFTLGVTTLIDLVIIFLFTHPMMELLITTRFFGQGHRLSGLDPEHLGAKSGLTYAGRGRVVARGGKPVNSAATATSDSGEGTSIAQRRRAQKLAALEAASHTDEEPLAERAEEVVAEDLVVDTPEDLSDDVAEVLSAEVDDAQSLDTTDEEEGDK